VNVDVIIPVAGDCEHRAAALDWVIGQWGLLMPAWGVVIGHGDPDPGRWCKADAVADALERSTADVVVVHDGDSWSDGTVLAVAEGLTRRSWAMPHGAVHRLTEAGTRRVLAGDQDVTRAAAERPYTGFAGGGIVALRREVYDRVPLDCRFVGWGYEDESWARALGCLVGPRWSAQRPLRHLWHPPQFRESRGRGSAESWELRERYRLAVKDRSAMAELLEGAHTPGA
jgi:hypothetical protein